MPAVDALPLGVAATSPLNMTDVYATFAAQGVQAPAHLVAKAVDDSGKVLYQASTKTTRVLTPGQAADETYALRQPFAYGTAAGLSPGRPVAGKTGTTDNNVSAWLCGYSPQLATCVAVSRANHKQSLNGIFNTSTEATGASTAGHTWQAFMTAALAGQPVLHFPDPVFGGRPRPGHAAPPPPTPSATVDPDADPTTQPTIRSPTDPPRPSAAARPTQRPLGPPRRTDCRPDSAVPLTADANSCRERRTSSLARGVSQTAVMTLAPDLTSPGDAQTDSGDDDDEAGEGRLHRRCSRRRTAGPPRPPDRLVDPAFGA